MSLALSFALTSCASSPNESNGLISPSATPETSESSSNGFFGISECLTLNQEVAGWIGFYAETVISVQGGSQEQGEQAIREIGDMASTLRDKVWEARAAINLSDYADTEEAKATFMIELDEIETLLTGATKYEDIFDEFIKYSEDQSQLAVSCVSLPPSGNLKIN